MAVARTTGRLPDVDPRAMRLILSLYRASNAMVYDLESAVHRPHGWSWAAFALWLVGPQSAMRVAQLSGMSRACSCSRWSAPGATGPVSRCRRARPVCWWSWL